MKNGIHSNTFTVRCYVPGHGMRLIRPADAVDITPDAVDVVGILVCDRCDGLMFPAMGAFVDPPSYMAEEVSPI